MVFGFDQVDDGGPRDTEKLGFYAGLNIFVAHVVPELDENALHRFFGQVGRSGFMERILIYFGAPSVEVFLEFSGIERKVSFHSIGLEYLNIVIKKGC